VRYILSVFKTADNIDSQSFIVRYADDEGKRFALYSMAALTEGQQFKNWQKSLCSHHPAVCVFFDVGGVLRALMKIGLNLIAAYCHNTPVNHTTFQQAMRLILGEAQPNPTLFGLMGFVRASDVGSLNVANAGHSFRLVHLGDHWRVYFSFFGGRIGAFVYFPGPNYESWKCADIVAPIRSKEWQVRTTRIVQPLNVKIEWRKMVELIPSLELQNCVSNIQVLIRPRTQ